MGQESIVGERGRVGRTRDEVQLKLGMTWVAYC